MATLISTSPARRCMPPQVLADFTWGVSPPEPMRDSELVRSQKPPLLRYIVRFAPNFNKSEPEFNAYIKWPLTISNHYNSLDSFSTPAHYTSTL